MFWNRRLLYKGKSIEKYNNIINILELNNIKYKFKIENKNENKNIGPIVDKMIIGNLGQKEDFSYEYSVFVNKDSYEYAESLIKDIK